MDNIERLLDRINNNLTRIADALGSMAQPKADFAPDHVRPIEDFPDFNWDSIKANIIRTDDDGPTHVEWRGQVFTRRSPRNKFDPAIWYSRSTGKNGDGENEYIRLITFREIKDADPIDSKARSLAARVSLKKFMTAANEKNIAKESALLIAQNVLGIKKVDPDGDYSSALHLLDYFSQAKQAGKKFQAAWKHLESKNMDAAAAASTLSEIKE